MQKQLNLGVVGFGYWGPNLVRNFLSIPTVNSVKICDLDADRLTQANELFPTVETTQDFNTLLADSSIDAIAVSTTAQQHFALAKAAFEAGKHVFIEKPMATSVAQCDELIAISKERQLSLMVGHTFLYSPAVKMIKSYVDRGDIGEIRYISAKRLNLGIFQKDINVVWDLAPHDISIILFIMGDTPVSVNCQGSAHVTPGVEDVASLTLKFSNERSALIHNSWLDPRKVREMTIVGSKRMIAYDDLEPIEKVKIYDARVDAPPHYSNFGEFQYAYHYGDRHIPYIKQEEPLKVECRHFIACIQRSRKPLTDGENGKAVVKILEAAAESLKQNGSPVFL